MYQVDTWIHPSRARGAGQQQIEISSIGVDKLCATSNVFRSLVVRFRFLSSSCCPRVEGRCHSEMTCQVRQCEEWERHVENECETNFLMDSNSTIAKKQRTKVIVTNLSAAIKTYLFRSFAGCPSYRLISLVYWVHRIGCSGDNQVTRKIVLKALLSRDFVSIKQVRMAAAKLKINWFFGAAELAPLGWKSLWWCQPTGWLRTRESIRSLYKFIIINLI